MTREELVAEKADLTRKLDARVRAGSGYKQNIEAIKARLADIEKELTADNG